MKTLIPHWPAAGTTEISSATISRQPGRIVFVGFSWSRAADKNPEQFEFDK